MEIGYALVGFSVSAFYAIRAHGMVRDVFYKDRKAPWWEMCHQIWFNFAGSAMGWLIAYWLVRRLSGSQNLSAVDVPLMVFAALGIVGYIPQTLNAIPGLLQYLSNLAANKMKESVSKADAATQ